jgi:hypothetical protein
VNTASKQDAEARAKGWALVLASVASLMVVLDLLVVATALNTIRRDLGASIVQLECTVSACTFAFAVLQMSGRRGRQVQQAADVRRLGAVAAGL